MLGNNDSGYPSLVERLTEDIFEKIVSGELKAGEKVTEEQLADTFGVSRTPVREAVKRLSEFGIFVVRPRSGISIATIDEEEFREILRFRFELESAAIRLGMENVTDAHIEKLKKIQEELLLVRKSGSKIDLFNADNSLHIAFAEPAGNRYLTETLHRLNVKFTLCRIYFCTDESKIDNDLKYHSKVIEGIEKRDADAAIAALKEHILNR